MPGLRGGQPHLDKQPGLWTPGPFFGNKKFVKNDFRGSKKGRLPARILLALIICGLLGRVPGPAAAAKASRDITIRNATREAVSFRIRETSPGYKSTARRLAPGVVYRMVLSPIGQGASISFKSAGKPMTYSLKAGKAYAFRYSEDGVLGLYEGSHGRTDVIDLAPFVVTPMSVVEKMLDMAQVTSRDVVYDLGSGDGRIVIAAAKRYGARGVGIELDPALIEISRAAAKKEGVDKLVEFRMEDATKADLMDATVVTLYLLPESNELLRALLEIQLKPGSRVVSHNYHIPGWAGKEAGFVNLRAEDGEMHEIYLYLR